MAEPDRQATIARLTALMAKAREKNAPDLEAKFAARLATLEGRADYPISETEFPVRDATPTEAGEPAAPPAPTVLKPGQPGYQEPHGGGLGDYFRAFRGGAADELSYGFKGPERSLVEAELRAARERGRASADPDNKSLVPRDIGETALTPEQAQEQAYSVSRHPIAAMAGQAAAFPWTLGGKALGAVSRLLRPVSHLGKVAGSAAEAAVGGGTNQTTRALTAGESIPEALSQGAQAAIVSTLPAAGTRHLNLKLRDPRELTGLYIQALEWAEQNGFLKSKEARGPGPLDNPATTPKGYSKGLAGVGEAARAQGERIAAENERRMTQANADWATGVEGPGRYIPDDLSLFLGDLNKSNRRYAASGRPVDPAVAAAVEEARLNLSRNVDRYEAVPGPRPPDVNPDARAAQPIERRALPGPEAATEVEAAVNTRPRRRREGLFTREERPLLTAASEEKALTRIRENVEPTVDADGPAPRAQGSEPAPHGTEMHKVGVDQKPIASIDDLTMQKQAWKDAAEFGQPQTKENLPYRKMYRAAVEATRRLAEEHPNPDLRAAAKQQLAADEAFMRVASDVEDVNVRLTGQDEASINNNVPVARRMGNELLQVLKDTQTSGVRRTDFEAIRNKGGVYEDAVNKTAAKASEEAVRFTHKPGSFAHAGSWVLGPLTQLSEFAKVRLMEPMTRPSVARQLSARAGDAISPGQLHDTRDILSALAERIRRLREEPQQ